MSKDKEAILKDENVFLNETITAIKGCSIHAQKKAILKSAVDEYSNELRKENEGLKAKISTYHDTIIKNRELETENEYLKKNLFKIVTEFVEDACINHEKRGKETMPEWKARFNKDIETYYPQFKSQQL